MARREATNPDSDRWTLTPQQETAVDLLAVGTTVTSAAESVGISRQTVSEWLNHHFGFRAALNRRREELWASITDRLRAVVPKAIDALEREIDTGAARVTAAVHVLKACALYGTPQSIGATDAEELATIEREEEADRFQRRLQTL